MQTSANYLGIYPLTTVTPFTYREGATMLSIMETFKEWAVQLGPEVQLIVDETLGLFNEQFATLTADVATTKDQWQDLFDAFMANVVAELEGLNDQAVANLANNPASKLSVALNALFANKATQETVESGRLSVDTLDSWWDDKFTSRHDHVVDIRDFGGKSEPGFDSAPALRAAVDYAVANGIRRVVTPGATFYFGSVLNLPSNIELDFMGANLHALPSNNNGLFETTSKGNRGYGSGGKNITIRNATIWGDFANGRIIGNSFHHAENLLVEDVIFNEAVQNSHNLDLMGCKDVVIRRCKFRGRLDVEGRLYVEAVQVDHSTRGGAGPNLNEVPESFDGLPCVNITMEDCVSEPITVGGTVYLAPRLIGSHSRVSDIRHKNITVKNCRIVNSGTTATDQRNQGWVHFTHTDGLLIDGMTFVNTRNDEVVAIGSWGVDTTYPLSSVGDSSPQINSAAGPVSSKNIIIKNIVFEGFRGSGTSVLIRVHGTGDTVGGYAENVSISNVTLDNAQPGAEAAHGSYVVSCARVNGLTVDDINVGSVAVGVTVEMGKSVSISRVNVSKMCSTPVRVVGSEGVTVTDIVSVGNNSLYLSGVSLVTVSNIVHRVVVLGAIQYAAIFSVSACNLFIISGISISGIASSGHEFGVRLYGDSSNGTLNGGVVSGFSPGFNYTNTTNVEVTGTVVA